ncbi:hypothetical protein H6G81_33030 [Scytonema hofmannii FACHB-248]|uniref:Uncharacterized protein n=1 Tax=Scytonema hofmannii FACHB-248 TaxID=1842502 RepID=A0ABR8H1I9_9CYAN|nr:MULTISPECIES: hypothetical protein [Nostocales]MBD2609207.1 hypothetical protein [Scytonema hofmannii FACHB-248]
MTDRINDIAWQAHLGSVAAIIQVLNEKLANSGVRTRAIFADGVLQLLCEARTVDKLEQSTLVKQIHQILESIAPRNIRRVKINSRIVQEQQLLWLEEISRTPENYLLWSEEITLAQPTIIQQVIQDFQERKIEQGKANLPKSQYSSSLVVINKNKHKKFNSGRMLDTLGLCLFLFVLGWSAYGWLDGRWNLMAQQVLKSLSPTVKSSEGLTNQEPEIPPLVSIPSDSTQDEDLFAAAVRIANQASTMGRNAQTSIQWLDLAARWQRASDLMSKVPSNHSRYKEAQIRAKLYREYSEAAQKEADKNKKSQESKVTSQKSEF